MSIWEPVVVTVSHHENWVKEKAGLGEDKRTKREA